MKTWFYCSNTFLNTTRNSYRACKKMCDYTLAALNAQPSDANIMAIYTAFKPSVDAFNDAYVAWTAQLGSQKGKTSALFVALKNLRRAKIKEWDIKIQNDYFPTSSEYVSILPNRRKSFQQGSQEDKMNAVQQLSTALTGIVPLATVKTDVDMFYSALKTAYDVQKTNIGGTGITSDALESARKAVCIELYAVLAQLMLYYKNTPNHVESYFDLETIRNHEQIIYNGSVAKNTSKLAITHTFLAGEQVRLVNKSTAVLQVALCATASSGIGTPMVALAPNQDVIVAVEALGNVANRFLMVENLDPKLDGKYMIMLL